MSETRIASYIAIARRQFPAAHYFGTWRTFPAGCDWDWQEQGQPVGTTRRYLGIDVFEGAYRYRGMRVVPRLGRLDVRGADAGHVRARGSAGRRGPGASTTR